MADSQIRFEQSLFKIASWLSIDNHLKSNCMTLSTWLFLSITLLICQAATIFFLNQDVVRFFESVFSNEPEDDKNLLI